MMMRCTCYMGNEAPVFSIAQFAALTGGVSLCRWCLQRGRSIHKGMQALCIEPCSCATEGMRVYTVARQKLKTQARDTNRHASASAKCCLLPVKEGIEPAQLP